MVFQKQSETKARLPFPVLYFTNLNPPCRWCCWGPLGLLADQWTIQTTASGVNGAQSSAAEEAV